MTRYGDDYNKQRGINEEKAIVDKVVKSLNDKGYKVFAQTSSLHEDMKDKVDAYLLFDGETPYINGKTAVPIDVKSGKTITVLNKLGEDTLAKSKADYIIFDVEGTLHWREKNTLKQWVKDNPYRVKDNKKGDGSKWICVIY